MIRHMAKQNNTYQLGRKSEVWHHTVLTRLQGDRHSCTAGRDHTDTTPVQLWLSKLETHILLDPAIPLLEFKHNELPSTKLSIVALLVIFLRRKQCTCPLLRPFHQYFHPRPHLVREGWGRRHFSHQKPNNLSANFCPPSLHQSPCAFVIHKRWTWHQGSLVKN